MRALVISDTHFGAWTGRDLLREELFLERLAPKNPSPAWSSCSLTSTH